VEGSRMPSWTLGVDLTMLAADPAAGHLLIFSSGVAARPLKPGVRPFMFGMGPRRGQDDAGLSRRCQFRRETAMLPSWQ
jgi:hypothetical protein